MKLDIPEIDQIPYFQKILDDLRVGNNVFLVGAAGTGKTTLGEKVAHALADRKENDGQAVPFSIINCNQWTSPIDIKGGQTMEGYQEGALITAWRDGRILILDEMPKLDANTAGILNDALAKTANAGAIIFNGLNQPVKKHPAFGCIATGNTFGKGASGSYVGNNKQDASLLDRFSGSVYRVGFNEALERQLVYPVVVETCLKIRQAILEDEGKTGDDTEDLMTLRTMLNIQRIYELEMLRETRLKDAGGRTVPKRAKGKTMKDAFESYFLVMGPDKAHKIREQVGIERVYNSYRGKNERDAFIREYQRRNR